MPALLSFSNILVNTGFVSAPLFSPIFVPGHLEISLLWSTDISPFPVEKYVFHEQQPAMPIMWQYLQKIYYKQ